MFTGLIQSVGTIQRRGPRVIVEGCQPFSPLQLGDSVAVDGVCLTVADLVANGFVADVSNETLQRSTLGIKSQKGDFVNLEPALRLSDRLGGHLVSGHVDGLGKVVEIKTSSNSWDIEVKWQEKSFMRYICEKASIAINGISLTVATCQEDESSFSIAVIPHTWINTSLKYLNKGDLINLEADLMAKYAEKLLLKKDDICHKNNITSQSISKDWLDLNGWI